MNDLDKQFATPPGEQPKASRRLSPPLRAMQHIQAIMDKLKPGEKPQVVAWFKAANPEAQP